MKLYVDASYAPHEDKKSHTSGCVIFSRGAIMSKSIKQKLNTKSSTEAELVGTSEYVPTAIYARLFYKHKGTNFNQPYFIKITKVPSNMRKTDVPLADKDQDTLTSDISSLKTHQEQRI